MSDFKEVKKRGNAPAVVVKFANQHQKLLEMGFDSVSISEALEAAEGNLETATAVLLGEPTVNFPRPIAKVEPMKVVGKQAPVAKVLPKQDIKDIHNKFMATYKIVKCKEKGAHDKRMCIFYHSKGDRRRNPFELLYSCAECPTPTTETTTCEAGDNCLKTHNLLERMFHPDLFKISYCQRGANGQKCDLGNFCAFAHSEEDHRSPMSQSKALAAANATGTSPVSSAPVAAVSSSSNGTDSTKSSASLKMDLNGQDLLHVSKAMLGIQEKLVSIIRAQGTHGIISSELPKRFSDVYNERLELTDDAGERFRIKDLLLQHPGISVKTHKGHPKYVYEDVPESALPVTSSSSNVKAEQPVAVTAPVTVSAPSPAPVISYASRASAGMSYSAAINSSKVAAPVVAPTPVVAPVVEVAAPEPVVVAPVTTAPVAAPQDATNSSRQSRRRGPPVDAPVVTESVSPVVSEVVEAPSTVAPVNGRRRGPDATPSESLVIEQFSLTSLTAPASDTASLKQQVALLQSALEVKSAEYDLRRESLSEELRVRDAVILQLRSEKMGELNQFRHNISLIENALIETQRQESVYINEISLADTINKSSRARDDLTKFVNILKLQLIAKLASNGDVQQQVQASPVVVNNAATNVTKSTLSNFLSANGIGGNLSGVAAVSVEQPVVEQVAVVKQQQDEGPVHVHGTLMCSLPGCNQVGSFVCSACGKAGYCGAEHQRDHWGSHIHECSV